MSTSKTYQLLFPAHIAHAFNALQYLRAMVILAESNKDPRRKGVILYATCEEIAEKIGAPYDSLWRTLLTLSRAGILQTKTGPGGGYYITAATLFDTKVVKILHILGRYIPENGTTRASDRLNNAVADCLDITLEEFFRA